MCVVYAGYLVDINGSLLDDMSDFWWDFKTSLNGSNYNVIVFSFNSMAAYTLLRSNVLLYKRLLWHCNSRHTLFTHFISTAFMALFFVLCIF